MATCCHRSRWSIVGPPRWWPSRQSAEAKAGAGAETKPAAQPRALTGLPPLQGNPRYASLDVWRGLACLMVVFDHAAIGTLTDADVLNAASGLEAQVRWYLLQASRLALGPPLFFVISGYCIAASVDSLRRKGKSAFAFEAKRLWRTYPPYWAAFALIAALIIGLNHAGLSHLYAGTIGIDFDTPLNLTLSQWLGNLSLTETWRHHLGGNSSIVFTRVAWTLCYQEQFYAVCFLAVLLAPRRLYGVLAGLTAVVVGFRIAAWTLGLLPRVDGFFPAYWHEFAVGLAVYWRLNVATSSHSRGAVDLGLAILAIVGLAAGLPSTLAAAAFGLLLVAVRPYDQPLAVRPSLAAVRACGRRCFSIYLIHLPVCTILGTLLYERAGLTGFWTRALVLLPLLVAAGLAAGWLFFALVERHFAPQKPAASPTPAHAQTQAQTRAPAPATSPEPRGRPVVVATSGA